MNVRILISAMLCFLLIGYGVKLQAEPTESLPVEAGVIRGKVIDAKTREPMQFVNISVRKAGTTVPLKGMVTDETGTFHIAQLPEGSYTLSISFIGYKNPALCRAHRLVIQSLGTGQRDRCQFPHDNGLAARTASALYRNPAAPVFREYTQAADQNAQALFHGYGAYLPSARHRIAGAARTGQDAGSTVRKLHRDGGIETAV